MRSGKSRLAAGLPSDCSVSARSVTRSRSTSRLPPKLMSSERCTPLCGRSSTTRLTPTLAVASSVSRRASAETSSRSAPVCRFVCWNASPRAVQSSRERGARVDADLARAGLGAQLLADAEARFLLAHVRLQVEPLRHVLDLGEIGRRARRAQRIVGRRLRDLGAQLERARGPEAQVGAGEPRVADVGAFVDQRRAELELVAGELRRRARAGRRAAGVDDRSVSYSAMM